MTERAAFIVVLTGAIVATAITLLLALATFHVMDSDPYRPAGTVTTIPQVWP